MEFFYNGTGGAIDCLALAVVCAMAFWLGGKDAKLMAALALAVYFYDRTILYFLDEKPVAALAGLADFAAALIMFNSSRGLMARAFAMLFLLKLAPYTAFVSGEITFTQMANAVTVLIYGQFLLIIAGAAHGPGIKKLGRFFIRSNHSPKRRSLQAYQAQGSSEVGYSESLKRSLQKPAGSSYVNHSRGLK